MKAKGTWRIVVCDDEIEVRETVGEYLERRGFEVLLAEDGASLDRVLDDAPDVDLVVLDVTMPGEDGFSVLRRLRAERSVSVVMLTAAGESLDRIVGLELGADDYLAKPANLRELDARIRAVLRRPSHRNARPGRAEAAPEIAPRPKDAIQVGAMAFDTAAARLIGDAGQVLDLTSTEFRLLEALVSQPGRVWSRAQLIALAHGDVSGPQGRSIDNRIARLRRKIEANPSNPVLIRTVRGVGYMFKPHEP